MFVCKNVCLHKITLSNTLVPKLPKIMDSLLRSLKLDGNKLQVSQVAELEINGNTFCWF